MSKNLGNSGHTGYKMPKVLDIIARDGEVVTLLTCGHEFSFVPFEVQCQKTSVEEYVSKQENRDYYIGHRQRCENTHGEK